MFSLFMIGLVIALFFLEKFLAKRAGAGVRRPSANSRAITRSSAPKRAR